MKRQSILKRKKRKGVSAIVGYVLIITFGIIMAAIVYNYLKTYVPKDLLDCPESVSIFIKDYECQDGMLNITLKNNGKFNYAGYYIHGANNTNQKVATINLVENFVNSSNLQARNVKDSYIMFSMRDENLMTPGTEIEHYFKTTSNLQVIEITPVRFQKDGNIMRFVSCGKSSKIREEIICS